MKKIFILFALIIFSMIKFSYADYGDFTVNIPASNGNYEAIILKQSGSGYIGPRGEYYSSFPSVYQLQQTYGQGQPAAPAPTPAPVAVQQTNPNTGWNYQAEMQKQQTRENALRAQMQASADETQRRVDQANKDLADNIARNNKMWADKAKAEADAKRQQEINDAKWAADHKKQTDLGEMVSIIFGWMMLLLGLAGLAFLILAHVPSKLNDPHSGEGLSSLVAVRRGMTQANFNVKNSNFLYGEIFVVSVLLAIGLSHFVNGWIVFVVSFFGMIFMTVKKVAGFILVYIFSLFWMMTAAGFGFYICGGNFGTYGSILTAVIGGLVFGIAGMAISMGGHLSALEWSQDIGNQ